MNNPFGPAGYTSQGYNQAYFDPEAQEHIDDNKYARQIRHGFIRKVYGILAMQLALTTACGALFTLNVAAQTWLLQNFWITIPAGIIAIILLLIIACVPNMSQSVPTNYILLFSFTGCEAVAVGAACAKASVTMGNMGVLQAASATCIITLMLTLFAFQTKYDFTSFMAIMFYVTVAAAIFALFSLFFRSSLLSACISAAFALIMCAHIVIDTQYLIGSGKIRASEDDYILCSSLLYIDIINLFMHLLRLLQYMNRSN